MGKGKTVLVEYSSPNIAKPFHIGHLFFQRLSEFNFKDFTSTLDMTFSQLGDWARSSVFICAAKDVRVKEVIEKTL